MRFGLLAYTLQGRDVNLDISRVVGYRQFCNKLWNAVKFALTYLGDFVPRSDIYETLINLKLSKRDKFILSRLNTTIKDSNAQMASYNFAGVTTSLYSFFLYDLCDVYLELIKPIIGFGNNDVDAETKYAAQATLFTCLEQYLRLAHPLMPFVTEELWQRLPNLSSLTTVPSIMISRYPEEVAAWSSPAAEADTKLILDAIHAARSLRVDYRIPNNVKAQFSFTSDSEEVKTIFAEQGDDFCTLAKAGSIELLEGDLPKGWSIKVISERLSILVNLSGLVDVEAELIRLGKEVTRYFFKFHIEISFIFGSFLLEYLNKYKHISVRSMLLDMRKKFPSKSEL